MLKDLKKDFENQMKELAKKYFKNELEYYKVPAIIEIYNNLETEDVFMSFNEERQKEIINYIYDYYINIDSENISLYQVCEAFIYIFNNSIEDLDDILNDEIDIDNYIF